MEDNEKKELTEEEVFKDLDNNIEEENVKRFEKYTIRDFVFLAISACAALLFSAVMPLVAHTPIYGLIQVVVGLQTSLFLSIGLFKVRKRGALLFMALCSGIVQVFMAPVMFFVSILSALLIELVFLIFKEGYHNNIIRYLATILYIPLQMPILYFYYLATTSFPEAYVDQKPYIILLMILAVIILCTIGTVLGNKIGYELERAGVLDSKKGKKKDV